MTTTTAPRARRAFGKIKPTPTSGRFVASYVGPDGDRHKAPATFARRTDAAKWLASVQTDIARGEWVPAGAKPATAPVETFGQYTELWFATRRATGKIKASTEAEYRGYLRNALAPLVAVPLDDEHFTPDTVLAWFAKVDPSMPTRRAHAYSFLRVVLNMAVRNRRLIANPCNIESGGQAPDPEHAAEPATIGELEIIAREMSDRYRVAVLLAAWCGLRFGEVSELRASDFTFDDDGASVYVARAFYVVDGVPTIGETKSKAGKRELFIPPHLVPMVRDHIATFAPLPGMLLFPAPGSANQYAVKVGGNVNLRSDGALHRDFGIACAKAGRPDLHFHDLRHTGATLAAATGASLKELMHRLGHSTPAAAMRYQHATRDRDKAIAAALSEFATGGVAELRPRRAG